MQSLADIKLSDNDPLHSTSTPSTHTLSNPTYSGSTHNTHNTSTQHNKESDAIHNSSIGDTYEIRVHFPESRVDNNVLGREYLVYRVTVTHIHTDGSTDQTVSYRRYSDFEWLHQQLCQSYVGYLIPPIPEKWSIADVASSVVSRSVSNVSTGLSNVISQFTHTNNTNANAGHTQHTHANTAQYTNNEQYVESRRKYLELFLIRCQQHVVLRHASQLKFFLTASDQAMLESRTVNTNAQSDVTALNTSQSNITTTATNALTSTKASIYSMFNTGVSTLQSTFGATTGTDTTDTSVLSSDDIKCNSVIQYANSLETKLGVMYNELNRMSKLLSDHADILSEHTLTCTAIEQLEISAPCQQTVVAQLFHQLGTTSNQLSEIEHRQVNDDNTTLKDTIKDYIRICDAMKQMCNARSEYRDELYESSSQTVLDTVSNHKLSEITARVFNEFEQFKQTKQTDLLTVMTEYHKLHIDNLQKQQQLHQIALEQVSKLNNGTYR